MHSVECDSDHRLVRGKFKLRIRGKVRMTGVRVPKCIDVDKLKNPELQVHVKERLDSVVFDGS